MAVARAEDSGPSVNASASSVTYSVQPLSRLRALQLTEQQQKEEEAQEKWEASLNRAAQRDRIKSTCAVNVFRVTNFVARFAFSLHSIIGTCPRRQLPPGLPNPQQKGCIISSAGFITSISQLATGLTIAAGTCKETAANAAELCTPPIAVTLTPLAQLVGTSTAISAACTVVADQIPKDVELDRRRRLQDGGPPGGPGGPGGPRGPGGRPQILPWRYYETPEEAKRWAIGECVVDATTMLQVLGQLGNAFAAAVNNCPRVYEGTGRQIQLSLAACIFDSDFVFFTLGRFVLFLAISVEHCTPGNQQEALCVAGVSGLTSAVLAMFAVGSGLYIGCEVGTDRPAIAQGLDVPPDARRRLTTEGLFEWYSNATNREHRLTKEDFMKELLDEAKGHTLKDGEDLFLKIGYNLSDLTAPWLKEDPESSEILARGSQMMRDMRTEREEPSEELLTVGPEEALPSTLPAAREAAPVNCSEVGMSYDAELFGHEASLEGSPAKCQARCASTVGCARFSYFPPHRLCRLHGLLSQPLRGEPEWISGPPGCHESQISESTLRLLRRKEECFHPHAVYEPRDTLAKPAQASSLEDCQRRCQSLDGCAHWVYSEADGTCSFADKAAVKLQPVMWNVAGPRHCPDAAVGLPGAVSAKFEQPGAPIGVGAAALPWALCALVAFALWGLVVVSRRVRRSYERLAPQAPKREGTSISAVEPVFVEESTE